MVAVEIEKLFQNKFKTDVEVKKSSDLNQSSESVVRKLSFENKPTTITNNNKRFRTNEEASYSLKYQVDEKKFSVVDSKQGKN